MFEKLHCISDSGETWSVLKSECSDGVTHRGCGGCFRAGWPVLLVDGVVEVVLAFVWERQTQSKQASHMCRHNQRAVGGQGEITR